MHLFLKRFFKNVNSLVKTQQIFCEHFNIAHPRSHNTTQLWVKNIRMSASALKKRNHHAVCIQCDRHSKLRLRQSFIRSTRRSAGRHSVTLAISDGSMRRILHKDLNFHPYKIVVMQELSDYDVVNCSIAAKRLIGILSDVIIRTSQMKHTSTNMTVSTNRIFTTGQRKIHSSPINGSLAVHIRLVWSGKLRSHRPLFLWRWRWACSYSHICSLGWNVIELHHTRTKSSWNWALNHMVPARWHNCPYNKIIHGGHSRHVSGACYFTALWAYMGCRPRHSWSG
jgi:hypothetical protein